MTERNYSGARAAVREAAKRFGLTQSSCACAMTEEARYHMRRALDESGFADMGQHVYRGQCVSVEMMLLNVDLAESEAAAPTQ